MAAPFLPQLPPVLDFSPEALLDGLGPDPGAGLPSNTFYGPTLPALLEGPRPLTQDEVGQVVQQEIQSALGSLESELSEERRRAINMYYARPFGNEQEGRSQVVLSDVRDCIEWIMPSLVRMLLGGRLTFRYKEKRPQDKDAAEQATEYINYLVRHEANAYQTLQDWMKTALLEKNGFVKAYYEERTEPRCEVYKGLELVQVQMLQDEGAEVIEATPRDEVWIDETQGLEIPVQLWDVKVKMAKTEGFVCIEGIPPEEYLHARRAITLDDKIPFCAHRTKVTISDLVARGYPIDEVWELPSDDLAEFTVERVERRLDEESYPFSTPERIDGASREVWLTECYINIDEDGDGFAERRKITVVGESSVYVLDDEYFNYVPIASLTAIPVPHKFFGLSIAEVVEDLQIIRSTLLRQMLDNLYLVNNGRWEVVEDFVEIDDLIHSTPGGVVRVDQPGMINPLQTQPLPPAAFNMLEFLENVKENRTGVLRYANGLDASALHETASGVSALMGAAMARVELIARNFAETGFTRLGKILLRILKEAPVKERVFKLRGEWVTINPALWNEDMDVEIEVGLGVGQANERIQQLTMLMDLQKQMIEGGLGGIMVDPDQLFAATQKLTEAMGFPATEVFVKDPQGQPFPQPAPPEQVQVAQMRQQTEAEKQKLDAAKIEFDRQKEEALSAHRSEELSVKLQIELAKIASDERIALERLEVERLKVQAAREKTNDDDNREAA